MGGEEGQEEEEVREELEQQLSLLEQLPPELAEQVYGLLPSSSLHSLSSCSPSLTTWAQEELAARHLASGPGLLSAPCPHLSHSLARLCPGLLLLHCPSHLPPPSLPHTVSLCLARPILPSSHPCQAFIFPHFQPYPNKTPHCIQVCPLPLCLPQHSAILYLLPCPPCTTSLPSWNILLPPPAGLASLLPPSFSRVSLPSHPQEALTLLTTKLPSHLSTCLVLVVTDCTTSPAIYQALQTCLARLCAPARLCWLKGVFLNRGRQSKASNMAETGLSQRASVESEYQ